MLPEQPSRIVEAGGTFFRVQRSTWGHKVWSPLTAGEIEKYLRERQAHEMGMLPWEWEDLMAHDELTRGGE